MASPCHNLAHLPVPTPLVPWPKAGGNLRTPAVEANPFSLAGRCSLNHRGSYLSRESQAHSLPEVTRGHSLLQLGPNLLFHQDAQTLWTPCPVLAMTTAEDAAMD